MTPPTPVRLLQLALWMAVAAGPVLGVAAMVVATVAGRQPAPPAVPDVGTTTFAELVVLQHLTSRSDPPARLQPVHQQLRPAVDDTGSPDGLNAPSPLDVAAVAALPAGPGRWGVTVMVLGRDGEVESWQVTIAETSGGPVVEGVPALVPTPQSEPSVSLALGALEPPVADDPLATTVEGFLRAVLLGNGEVERWTAVDSGLAALDRPVAEMSVRRVARHRVSASAVAVMAEVELRRHDGSVVIAQYPLLLVEAEGRIEVVRVLPALPLVPTGP